MRFQQGIWCILLFSLLISALPAADLNPLPSWNDGPAKQAILDFVKLTTDKSNPKFVAPCDRIAVFDQDGTLWVSHPMYTQVIFTFDRVVSMAPHHPEWKTTEPFKSIINGNKEAIAKFTNQDLEEIFMATHTGMSVEDYQTIVKQWINKAKHPRWNRLYLELIYQPMLELMCYLRANGYKTYIVTGGGQDFVRSYSDQTYGIPPEQVIGSALTTTYSYESSDRILLMRSPKLLLNNNLSGKPEDVHLFIGRRPNAAFGNSTGDQQMLEYTQAGGDAHLIMLVLHDDAQREYAYGPTNNLPDTNIGTFSQALMDEANANSWIIISMKNDWKRIFAFER